MLHLYSGTDRAKARAALNKALEKVKGARLVRITDANAPEDLVSALQGAGMFAEKRVIVLEGVLENDEMRHIVLASLERLKSSGESFFMLEEKPAAATRKQIEKYSETVEKFDAPKKAEGGTTIFALANALRAGDKKALWVGYQRELLKDAAPEAIHGVLFWAAKDMMLKSRNDREKNRAKEFVARLADLPHESRRRGEDLEYALERFVLSVAPAKS